MISDDFVSTACSLVAMRSSPRRRPPVHSGCLTMPRCTTQAHRAPATHNLSPLRQATTTPRSSFVLTDPDFGPAPGTYRAKITDEWTFEYVGLFGPLLIRPAGGPKWLTKSIRSGGVDITDTVMPFGRPNQSLDDVDVVLTNRG